MKGTIVKCLEALAKSRGGDGAWKAVMEGAGMPAHTIITPTGTVADGDVLKLIGSAAKTLKVTAQAAMDAFGEYWSTIYAPGLYKVYFERAKSTKDFLLLLDDIHVVMTKSMAGAAPPRFRYEDKGKELVMHYSSPRGLVALMPGLIHGVAKFYREKVGVRVEGSAVHITFA